MKNCVSCSILTPCQAVESGKRGQWRRLCLMRISTSSRAKSAKSHFCHIPSVLSKRQRPLSQRSYTSDDSLGWAGRLLPAQRAFFSEPETRLTDQPTSYCSEGLTVCAADVRQRDGVDGARTAGAGHGCGCVQVGKEGMCQEGLRGRSKLCFARLLCVAFDDRSVQFLLPLNASLSCLRHCRNSEKRGHYH